MMCPSWLSVQVTWTKDNVEIKQSSRVHSVHSEQSEVFSLRIRAVGPGDLGNYTCSLSLDNTAGNVKTDLVRWKYRKENLNDIVIVRLTPPRWCSAFFLRPRSSWILGTE